MKQSRLSKIKGKLAESKGVVSVFLALILIPTYLVSVSFFDGARLYAANNYLMLANESALESLLLNYDKDLFNNFGLLSIASNEDLEKLASLVVEKNLTYEPGQANKLKHKSTKLDMNPERTLINPRELEKQIVKYMEFRAPFHIISGFINLLEMAKKSKSYNEVLAKRMAYNEELEKVNANLGNLETSYSSYQNLFEPINGIYSSLKEKSFILQTKLERFDNEMNKIIYKTYGFTDEEKSNLEGIYRALMTEDFQNDLIFLKGKISKISKIQDIEKKKDLIRTFEDRLALIRDRFNKAVSILEIKAFAIKKNVGDKEVDLSAYIRKINDFRRGLVLSITDSRNKLLNDFVKEFSGLSGKIDQAIKALNTLETALQDFISNNSTLEEKLKTWEASIEGLENQEIKSQLKSEFIFSEKKFTKEELNKALIAIRINKERAEILKEQLYLEAGIFQILAESSEKFQKLDLAKKLTENKLESLEGMEIFKDLFKDKKPAKLDQSQVKEAKELKKKLIDFNRSNNYQKANKGNILDYVDSKAYELLGGNSKISANEKLAPKEISNSKDMKEVLNKASDNLTIKIDKSESIKNILISQYFDDKFLDRTELEEGEFAELEYILFGSDKLSVNEFMANSSIFATRLGINTVYAFSSPQIRKDALMLASSLAAWTGIGVPIVEAIIVSMLSFGESLIDSKKLSNGQDVELFKNSASWQLSFNGLKNLIANQANDLAKKSIANIMSRIEQVALEATDGAFYTLDEFISQSRQGLVQSISGSLVIPLQNKIVSLLSTASTSLETSLNDVFNELDVYVNSEENTLLKTVKVKALNYIKDNYYGKILDVIRNFPESGPKALTSLVEFMTIELEKIISKANDKYAADLKNKISVIASEKSADYQDKIGRAIDDYFGAYSSKSNDKDYDFAHAGLSLKYSDYLKMFMFLGLSSGKKDAILRRAALLIDYEMKRLNRDFSILRSYCSFKVESVVELGLIIDEIIFARKKEFRDEMERGFDY